MASLLWYTIDLLFTQSKRDAFLQCWPELTHFTAHSISHRPSAPCSAQTGRRERHLAKCCCHPNILCASCPLFHTTYSDWAKPKEINRSSCSSSLISTTLTQSDHIKYLAQLAGYWLNSLVLFKILFFLTQQIRLFMDLLVCTFLFSTELWKSTKQQKINLGSLVDS